MSGDGPPDQRGFTVRDRRSWMQDEQEVDSVQKAPADSYGKPSYVQELEEKLAAREKELRDLIATYKRDVTQTVEETKRRLERDAERQLELERLRLIESLLPILDNLGLALEAARWHGKDGDAAKLVQGVELVERQFQGKLAELGIDKYASVGMPFDPKLHEAVSTTPVGPEEEGRVINELRAGYRLGDRVIRPAMVQVGRKRA